MIGGGTAGLGCSCRPVRSSIVTTKVLLPGKGTGWAHVAVIKHVQIVGGVLVAPGEELVLVVLRTDAMPRSKQQVAHGRLRHVPLVRLPVDPLHPDMGDLDLHNGHAQC